MNIEYKNIDEIKPYENNPRDNDEGVEYVANINSFINEIVEAYETQIINKVTEKLQEENEAENTEEVIEDE